jgi:glutamine amidotransferase
MIAVIDYGMGNLRSVEKALQRSGGDARIVTTAAEIARADKIVLPGVAAFGEAMEHIIEHKLDDAIRDTVASGTPYLGFCLGMQMVFEASSTR